MLVKSFFWNLLKSETCLNSKRRKKMLSWDKTDLKIFCLIFPSILEEDNYQKTTPILSVVNAT
jgi:hypothetical protein